MPKLRHICRFFLLPAALVVSSAMAQTGTGTLRGTMTDDSGGVIPAANVTLTGKGVTKTAQTQVDGSYVFQGLAPGQYTVKVAFPGFAPINKPVNVTAGSNLVVPIQMVVAAEKQEITVADQSTTALSVEPDNNATALVLRGEDLAALPDDPDDLSDALQALAGPGAGPNGGSIYIDGFSGGQLPPKESIREIRINQNPFSAEYDKLGFGRIEILTKPGSDKVRGSLGFNDSDGVFNSRNPISTNKPDFSSRMFSGNIGGPLGKRASFFFDFNRRQITDNALVDAVYVDPDSLLQSRIQEAVVTPNTRTSIGPRIDYQLSTNNTLVARFEYGWNSRENQGIGGYSLPPPYAQTAYNSTGNNQNLMLTETWIVNPKIVNETRFQYTRNYSRPDRQPAAADQRVRRIHQRRRQHGHQLRYAPALRIAEQHFDLCTAPTPSAMALRARRESDRSLSPNGFGGVILLRWRIRARAGCQQQHRDRRQRQSGADHPLRGGPVFAHAHACRRPASPRPRSANWAAARRSSTSMPAILTRASCSTISACLRRTIGACAPTSPSATACATNGRPTSAITAISRRASASPGRPGSAKNGRQKTVIRGGFGMFYDRVNESLIKQAFLLNGVNQLSYTVTNPDTFPNAPSLANLSPAQNSIYRLDPNLRSDYMIQSAIGVERQLPRNTTVAVTYTNTRALHMEQTVPINTPLPGTYIPGQPG